MLPLESLRIPKALTDSTSYRGTCDVASPLTPRRSLFDEVLFDDQETLGYDGHLPWDYCGRMLRKRPELVRPSVLEGFPKVLCWRKCHGVTVRDGGCASSIRSRPVVSHTCPATPVTVGAGGRCKLLGGLLRRRTPFTENGGTGSPRHEALKEVHQEPENQPVDCFPRNRRSEGVGSSRMVHAFQLPGLDPSKRTSSLRRLEGGSPSRLGLTRDPSNHREPQSPAAVDERYCSLPGLLAR